jgi:hypothetical protein
MTKVTLSYANPSVNGKLLFTVAAKDVKTGKVYHEHRFDLEDDGHRRAFCERVGEALESQDSAADLEALITEYAAGQRNAAKGQAATARAVHLKLGRPLAAYRPFPTDVLPFAVARFVREAAVAVGCDESFVALPALVGLASAVGNSRVVRVKFDWHEPAVLWAAVIAGSGERKSPPFYKALKPLHDMQAAALKEHRAAMEEYKRDLSDFKRELKAYRHDRRGAGRPAGGEPAGRRAGPRRAVRLVRQLQPVQGRQGQRRRAVAGDAPGRRGQRRPQDRRPPEHLRPPRRGLRRRDDPAGHPRP